MKGIIIMNNKTIKIIEEIIAVGLVVIPIIMLIINCNFVDKIDSTGTRDLYINWTLYFFEIINIIILIYTFKKKSVNIFLEILLLMYIATTFFIVSYSFEETYAAPGPNSYLQGLAFKRTEKNIYGITINEK